MNNRSNRDIGRNVFEMDVRPNFHSNKQLVDILSRKDILTNSSSAPSVSTAKGKLKKQTATQEQSPNSKSKPKSQLPKSQSLKKLNFAENAAEFQTFKTRKQSFQKTFKIQPKPQNSNVQQSSRACCPAKSCPHGTFCHNFAENINQFFKYQEITSLIKSLKMRTKTDVYAFHKVFDVLTRHCHHNRQLINDLKAI